MRTIYHIHKDSEDGKFYFHRTDTGEQVEVFQAASPYKKYAVLISQAGEAAPTVKVLENTLGGVPVVTRDSAGTYLITLADAFTADKTAVTVGTPVAAGDNFRVYAKRLSANAVQVESGDGADLDDDVIPADTFIEIRVYPAD